MHNNTDTALFFFKRCPTGARALLTTFTFSPPGTPPHAGVRALLIAAVSVLAALILLPVSAGAEPLKVAASIQPQAYFIKKIGGDLVSATILVPPGANPATYEPKPTQMVAVSASRLYFAIGVPFERAWLPRFSSANPSMAVVHTDAGIRKIPMHPAHHHDTFEHPSEAHDRETGDPHIWLSPALVRIQAKHILEGLTQADPVHTKTFEANYLRFSEEIDRLDADLRNLFSNLGQVRFLVFHPSWGYFAEAYGLEQIPIEFEGKDPKPAVLQALIKKAAADGIKVVFVQPQFSTRSAETIATAIGGKVMTADPLAADWEENLRQQAAKIKSALK